MPDIVRNTQRQNELPAQLVGVGLPIAVAALAVKYSMLSAKPDSGLNDKENPFSIALNGIIACSTGLCSAGYLMQHINKPKNSENNQDNQKSFTQKNLEIGQNPILNCLSFLIAATKFAIPTLLPNSNISHVGSVPSRALNALTAYYLSPKTLALLVSSFEKARKIFSKESQLSNEQIYNQQGEVVQENVQNVKDYKGALDSSLFTLLLGSAVLKFGVQSAFSGSKNTALDAIIALSSIALTMRNADKFVQYLSNKNSPQQII